MPDLSTEEILGSVLAAYQLRARVSDNPVRCGDWRIAEPQGHAYFHLIASGHCWLKLRPGQPPLELHAGDFIVLPHGSRHELLARPSPAVPPPNEDCYTTLICGELAFTPAARNPLLEALPDVILVRAAEGGARFRQLAQLLRDEIQAASFASHTVVDKLADALFVMAVRHHLVHAQDRRGLVAALMDPRLARALAAMHARPAEAWTVAGLARIAAMSRTAFTQRFAAVLGHSPIAHLTQWRMLLAERLLQDRQLSVATVAEQVGYRTEAAFRRRFKRHHGFGPGHIRRATADGRQVLTTP